MGFKTRRRPLTDTLAGLADRIQALPGYTASFSRATPAPTQAPLDRVAGIRFAWQRDDDPDEGGKLWVPAELQWSPLTDLDETGCLVEPDRLMWGTDVYWLRREDRVQVAYLDAGEVVATWPTVDAYLDAGVAAYFTFGWQTRARLANGRTVPQIVATLRAALDRA